jgi:ribonucleotide monophosphatase NagD (HAD superfamily)
MYRTMGGEVLYAGKPYRPIYDMSVSEGQVAAGRDFPRQRILAIGDSVRTDLTGAHAFGINFMFIMAGIHAEELGGRERLDHEGLESMFADAPGQPKAVMRQLAW